MTPTRIKFLTGAPRLTTLGHAEDALLEEWSAPFKRFLNNDIPTGSGDIPHSIGVPNWRHVPLNGKLFYETPVAHKTGRRRISDTGNSIFYTKTRDAKAIENLDFLEHSFAVHDNLQSSQIAPQDSPESEQGTTFVTTTSFTTSSLDDQLDSSTLSILDSATKTPIARHQTLRITGPITPIRALPSPSHLFALRPQTMTTNLIVGVITISPPKTITLKRGNYTMDVIELLVGDETRAGFSISSWLNPSSTSLQRKTTTGQTDSLRSTLNSLRTGDVLLIERLALSVYRDKVFGQTLNRSSTRNTTRFVVLDENVTATATGVSPAEGSRSATTGNVNSVTAKIQHVRDWVDGFVGVAVNRKRKADVAEARKGKKRAVSNDGLQTTSTRIEEEYLPDDTQ